MKKKRTWPLFRFATLRSPELISKDRKKLGFIEHPTAAKSKILKTASESETVASLKAAITETADPFTPFSTVQ